jgi:hypothetical protein
LNITLPPNEGDVNYVLRTDGAGVTTWVNPATDLLTLPENQFFVGDVSSDPVATGDRFTLDTLATTTEFNFNVGNDGVTTKATMNLGTGLDITDVFFRMGALTASTTIIELNADTDGIIDFINDDGLLTVRNSGANGDALFTSNNTTTVSSTGGDVTVTTNSGAAELSSTGGNVLVTSNSGTATLQSTGAFDAVVESTGGNDAILRVTGGTGNVTMTTDGGNAVVSSTFESGTVDLSTATGSTAGDITLTTGSGDTAGGAITLTSGDGTTGTGSGGDITLTAGSALVAGNTEAGGSITMQPGDSTSGNIGNLVFKTASDDAPSGSQLFNIISFQNASANLASNPRMESDGQFYATAFNAVSDAQFKQDIIPLTHALETVRKIEGYSYDWKEGLGPKRQIGVIAQQLEEIGLDNLVSGTTSKSVNYMGIIPLLVEAIKELSLMVESGNRSGNRSSSSLDLQMGDLLQIFKS